MSVIHCVQCHSIYPETGVPYRCPECSGIYDFREFPNFSLDEIDKSQPGMWQYRHAFGLPESAPQITLGEGNTPLVWTNYDGISVALKLEMLNPSGSYKDRGSAVLLSKLKTRGVVQAVEDLSGNAGASFAAYAARAGIQSRIFVPESASGPKRNQIEQYGAELVSVPGPRSEAARAVLEEVAQGAVYASHAFLPFGLAGIASIAYEIWEQLSTIPGSVIIPVGHGSLMLGIMRGFKALQTAGIVEKVPYFVGVQAGACAPVVAEYMKRKGCETTVYENPTVAEGVQSQIPGSGCNHSGRNKTRWWDIHIHR